jgi:murein DD-endopeptidase MepM/ murein hydrolase activator NlpD
MYFHLSEVTAKEGVTINTGEEIGRVGKSGRVTGPHLHWGMRLNGARIDPYAVIEKNIR